MKIMKCFRLVLMASGLVMFLVVYSLADIVQIDTGTEYSGKVIDLDDYVLIISNANNKKRIEKDFGIKEGVIN